MKILTENTGFQNIGKCLEGNCDVDSFEPIRDFLQFCIEFIFYDDIKLTGAVDKNTINASKLIIDRLHKEFDFPVIDFETIDDDSNTANNLVKQVSAILPAKISNFSKTCIDLTNIDAKEFVVKLSKEHYEILQNVTNSINERKEDFFQDNLKISKFSVDSCFFRIVNLNENIIKEIFNVASEIGWNDAMSYYLLSEVRYNTNKIFACDRGFTFLPSVKRGREEHKRIIEGIDSILVNDKIEKKYQLKMASLCEIIIHKGKGNPEKVLEEARKLRDEYKHIRELLKEATSNPNDDFITLQKLLDEISSILIDELNNKLNLKQSTVVENAFTPEEYRIINKDKCVQSFTEAINYVINNEKNYNEYNDTFIRNCKKNKLQK